MRSVGDSDGGSQESVRLYAETIKGYELTGDGMTDNLPRAARVPNPNEGIMSGHRRIPVGHIALMAERIASHEDGIIPLAS